MFGGTPAVTLYRAMKCHYHQDTEKVKYDTPPTKTSWTTGSSFLLIIKMKRKKLRLILYKVVSLKEIFCSKYSS